MARTIARNDARRRDALSRRNEASSSATRWRRKVGMDGDTMPHKRRERRMVAFLPHRCGRFLGNRHNDVSFPERTLLPQFGQRPLEVVRCSDDYFFGMITNWTKLLQKLVTMSTFRESLAGRAQLRLAMYSYLRTVRSWPLSSDFRF